MEADFGKLSTWKRFSSQSMCDGCRAYCCHLPVEVTASDLLRLGLATTDETTGSLRRLARRLEKEGITHHFRASTGLFTLSQKPDGSCKFLGSDSRCTVYETRPDVCRRFPSIGPRPGFCPHQPITRAKFRR